MATASRPTRQTEALVGVISLGWAVGRGPDHRSHAVRDAPQVQVPVGGGRTLSDATLVDIRKHTNSQIISFFSVHIWGILNAHKESNLSGEILKIHLIYGPLIFYFRINETG